MAEVHELTRDIRSAAAEQRLAAAEALCQMGADAKPAAVALVQASGDEDEAVREQAVAALEELGPPRVDDVPSLVSLLRESKPEVAYWAATLLGRLEAAGAAAAAALGAALSESQDASVRQRAAWALGKIGPAASAALAQLQSASAHADARLARLVKEAMELISRKRN